MGGKGRRIRLRRRSPEDKDELIKGLMLAFSILLYETEDGKILKYDGIYGVKLDYYDAVCLVFSPQNFIPREIVGRVEKEDEFYLLVRSEIPLAIGGEEFKPLYRFEKMKEDKKLFD